MKNLFWLRLAICLWMLITLLLSDPLAAFDTALSAPNNRSTLPAVADSKFWLRRRQLHAEFHESVDNLQRDSGTNWTAEQKKNVARFLFVRDPERQYIFLPPESQVGAVRFEGFESETTDKLNQLFENYASKLFELAAAEANQGNAAWAYQLLNEVLFYAPDHLDTRKTLGHRAIGKTNKIWRFKSDRIRIQKSNRREKNLGWAAQTYWIGNSPHFQVFSAANRNETEQLMLKLERWHDVWRQVFFDYHSDRKNLQRWLSGKSKPSKSKKKYRVVFFADRNQYVATLSRSVPGVEVSSGYYNDVDKRSYFFASSDGTSEETWRHELTHQLFQESRRSVASPFADHHLWLGEGIAMYFESLIDHGDYLTLGGFDARRLQFARLRRLKEGFKIPVNRLAALDAKQFQSLPQIPKVYSQSAGFTQMLMTVDDAKYQANLISLLSSIYQGKLRSHSLEQVFQTAPQDLEKQYDDFLKLRNGQLKHFDASSSATELALIGMQLSEDSLESVGKKQWLKWLELSASTVTQSRLQWLKGCERIDQIFLTGAVIDDQSIQILAELPVVEVDLSGTALNDRQLELLAKSKTIRVLNVSSTQLTKRSVAQFSRIRPDIQLSTGSQR